MSGPVEYHCGKCFTSHTEASGCPEPLAPPTLEQAPCRPEPPGPQKITADIQHWLDKGYKACDPARAYVPECPGRKPEPGTEKRDHNGFVIRECGARVEMIVRPGYPIRPAALCKRCNELEYSARWMKRYDAIKGNAGDENKLLAERERWRAKGHTYRGTADRTHVDRRAGTE